jgi:nucleoid-associated protein YgaU
MATTTFLEHICTDNTRWDMLSWQYYRNPYQWQKIVEANPTYRLQTILDAGVVLRIPQEDKPQPSLSSDKLPPWRR